MFIHEFDHLQAWSFVVVNKETHEVIQIDSASARALDACREDPALKEPKQRFSRRIHYRIQVKLCKTDVEAVAWFHVEGTPAHPPVAGGAHQSDRRRRGHRAARLSS